MLARRKQLAVKRKRMAREVKLVKKLTRRIATLHKQREARQAHRFHLLQQKRQARAPMKKKTGKGTAAAKAMNKRGHEPLGLIKQLVSARKATAKKKGAQKQLVSTQKAKATKKGTLKGGHKGDGLGQLDSQRGIERKIEELESNAALARLW